MSDEADRPKDSFELSTLEEELHRKLRETIERSRQHPVENEWAPEEQAELNSELAQIPFNPDHANPDFADHTITLEGIELQRSASSSFFRGDLCRSGE
jgi:hypothetical protein